MLAHCKGMRTRKANYLTEFCITGETVFRILKTCTSYFHHRHQLHGLGLLTCSDLQGSRIDPSISSVVDLSLFFLYGGSQTASEEAACQSKQTTSLSIEPDAK
jgi:hypothetical protein